MVFSFVHLVPGDPVQIMLGDGAPAADIEHLRSQLGLDRPIGEQCLRYLSDLSRGNLGTSFRFGEPVARIIWERYPATIQLAVSEPGHWPAVCVTRWNSFRFPCWSLGR